MRIEVDYTQRLLQISDFLKRCKPFTSGIYFAFDYINQSFNEVVVEVNEEDKESKLSEEDKVAEIKTRMIDIMQVFASHRIINANQVICQEATQQIKVGETILTFGANYTVKLVFLEAAKKGIDFNVFVVGLDADDTESIELVETLTNSGIECTFCQLNSLPLVARKVSKVLFGGISMMNNGYLVAKAGTASIACWAKSKMVPVVVCIESFKFSKQAVVHSLISSELRPSKSKSANKVNSKYDITPSRFIDMVVCEMG
jgi:translation initiation factor eIF-2B subunit delta